MPSDRFSIRPRGDWTSVNVKKAQFLAAHEMDTSSTNLKRSGNEKVLLCEERGSSFGYNNLVVDPLNFGIMKKTGCPVVFDVTHSFKFLVEGMIPRIVVDRIPIDACRNEPRALAGLFLNLTPILPKPNVMVPVPSLSINLNTFLTQAKAIDDLVKNGSSRLIESIL